MKGKQLMELVKVGNKYEFTVLMTKNKYKVIGVVTEVKMDLYPRIKVKVESWHNPIYWAENKEFEGTIQELCGNKITHVLLLSSVLVCSEVSKEKT